MMTKTGEHRNQGKKKLGMTKNEWKSMETITVLTKLTSNKPVVAHSFSWFIYNNTINKFHFTLIP